MKFSLEQINASSKAIDSLVFTTRHEIDSSNFPWGITDTSPWDMNLKITKKTIQRFKQEDLVTIQRTIARDKLRSMVANPSGVFNSPKPEIVNVDGLNLIYNGHHRLAFMWLYGMDEVDCLLLDAERL